jgi:hypothetical protein
MLPPDRHRPAGHSPSDPEEAVPLIPLLDAEQAVADPMALATWYEALGDLLGVEVPHDLFALWLYPSAGGAALIGPAALAQDQLAVPLPSPKIRQDQLFQLEERVRAAGYASSLCLAVPFGQGDVGLFLLAAFAPGRYGVQQGIVLQEWARRLGPSLARIARRWRGPAVPGDDSIGAPHHAADAELVRVAAAMEEVGRAVAEARTPREFGLALYAALQPVVPHDRAELLVPGTSADQWYRIGEHSAGALWSDPALTITREEVDVAALFGAEETLLVDDARRDPRWAGWPDGVRAMRSVAGVRLVQGGRGIGYLLLGSGGPGLYQESDAALLARLAGVVAPRIDNFLAGWHLQVLRTHLGSLRTVPAHLNRLSEILATTEEPGDALRRVALEAAGVLPFDRMRLAVAIPGSGARDQRDQVLLLEPGDPRHVAEIAPVSIAGTVLAQVVDGELPATVVSRDPECEIVVPLRIAGRVVGGLSLGATGGAPYTRVDLPLVQQIADALAPHVELWRRAAEPQPQPQPQPQLAPAPAPARTSLAPPAVPSGWYLPR